MDDNAGIFPYTAAALLEAIDHAQSRGLCPNRIWQSGGRFGEWHQELWKDLRRFCDNLPDGAALHEDHTACTLDYCEFSSRNFTAVRQYHEGYAYEAGDQETLAKIHTDPAICFPIQGLFEDSILAKAVECERLTPWSLDGLAILEHPRPFMAISHVWSDGTGSGSWLSKRINFCLYKYFRDIAEKFGCEGIWWDSLCIPQDRVTREKALGIMDMNYAYASFTLVHDRFLRNVPFGDPNQACFALVTSAWFTRGWTALELSQSRKVKVVFSDSIQDLDHDILGKAGSHAAQIIRNLRNKNFDGLEDLLSALAPRYTSWPKDRAKVAGLLAKIPSKPSQNSETWQRDIYQDILRSIGKLSHGHLFHKAATMSGGFSWCPTNIFEFPHTDLPAALTIKQNGDLEGIWNVAELDDKLCDGVLEKTIWGSRHPLLEENVRQALQMYQRNHVLLSIPSSMLETRPRLSGIRTAVIVKVMKARNDGGFKCRFIGALEFHSAVATNKTKDRMLTIGDTKDWAELGDGEPAWQSLVGANAAMRLGNLMNLSKSSQEQEGFLGKKVANVWAPDTGGDASKDPKYSQRDVKFDESCHWTALHRAAWLGDTNIRTDNFHASSQQDSRGQHALHLASERGYLSLAESLLRADLNSINVLDSNGQTPLHRAARGGSKETVRSISNLFRAIDRRDTLGRTALHLAASMGFDQVIEYLCIESAAEAVDLVNLETKYGLTALHYASMRGNYQAVKLLVDAGAAVTVANNVQKWSPLHLAAENGHASVVELLIENGADIEHPDVSGWTAIHFAAMGGHSEVVHIIAEAQPQLVWRQDQQGWSPIHFAVINGHSAIFHTVFKPHMSFENLKSLSIEIQEAMTAIAHRSPSKRDLGRVKRWQGMLEVLEPKTQDSSRPHRKLGWTRMHLAAIDGRSVTQRLSLSQNHCYNNEALARRFSALYFAVQHSLFGTVGLLIQLGASLEVRVTAGGARPEKAWTPLQRALYDADTLMVRLLIENGANYRARNESRTAMGWAAGNGLARAVETLIGTGKVDPDDSGLGREGYGPIPENITPISWAAYHGHERVVRLLLETRRVRLVPTPDCRSPLSYAVEGGNETIVKLMLSAYEFAGVLDSSLNDADPTTRGHDTPLMIAAKKGYDSTLRILLDFGAKTNPGTLNGNPLFYAAAEGHENIVETLCNLDESHFRDGRLDVGRKVRPPPLTEGLPINGRLSWSPISIAVYKGHEAVVRLLLTSRFFGRSSLDRDEDGRSPLTYAAMFGYEGIVRALLDSCIVSDIIDLKDQWGYPARWYAYTSGFGRIVELLDEKTDKSSWRLSLALRGQKVFKTEVGKKPVYVNDDLVPQKMDGV